MRKRPWLIWGAVLAAFCVAGTLLLRPPGAAGASSLSASPSGWLGARTYMERRGTETVLLDRALGKDSPPGPLVLAFPARGFASAEEFDALRQRVAAGGTVVYAYSGRKEGLLEGFAAETLGLDLESARGEPPLSPRKWYDFVRAEWRLKAEPAYGAQASEVVIRAPDRLPKAPKGAQVLYRGDGDKPAAFTYERGRGRVVVIPSDALSNSRLSQRGNADLLESIRVALGEAVVFDEYHHGLVSAAPRADTGSTRSLDVLLVQLVLLYLLCAWALGRRFGPSWQEPPEIASSTSAFLLGLGALHQKLRHSAPAALALIGSAERLDPRVVVPSSYRERAVDAKDAAFLEIARVVARLQGRGRSD